MSKIVYLTDLAFIYLFKFNTIVIQVVLQHIGISGFFLEFILLHFRHNLLN